MEYYKIYILNMIQAKIVADSITPRGERLTTLEVIMPRYILAEFNTHRVLSRNSASSRAIPFGKMVKEVHENPFIPYAWQKDHKGMQGNEYFTEKDDIIGAQEEWIEARNSAIIHSKQLNKQQVTKQLANRLLEPFMYHKVLVSGTEWGNFFNLRCPKYTFESKIGIHIYKSRKDAINNVWDANTDSENGGTIIEWLKVNKGQADIHMMFLAEAIWDATNESTPKKLKEGEWHIPYGDNFDEDTLLDKSVYGYESSNQETQGGWTIEGGEEAYYYILNELKCKISIARCARLSYQTLGDNPEINYEKDLELFEVLSKSGHYSPFEHVAKVMTGDEYLEWNKGKLEWDEDKLGYNVLDETTGWCRNFRGFIQYRTLID